LYVNRGKGDFDDMRRESGLAAATAPFTGFGTAWIDYDNDGALDLFIANGAVSIVEALRGQPYPYHERNQLFSNAGNGRFHEVPRDGEPALALSEVSRGVAVGDIDNDGRVDVLVANNSGLTRLLLNESAGPRHWLEVHLEGVQDNRMGLGAIVGLLRKGQPTLWRRAHTDGSYLSASDARVHFGLGSSAGVDAVVVRWPSRREETWTDIRADRIVTLRQGSGKATPSDPKP
jgi:hypothetical protein